MAGKVTVYISMISSDMERKKQQQKIEMILSSKKIDCEYVDVSASHDALEKMRELTNDAHALPPQIVNGDDYCGDFSAFEEAVENGDLKGFLKI
ncbi:hypothetical protein RRG08_008212 [Elysia crispata]|uniref:SH3 domain-binding glutamic acid-rich-like protein 3 n=1 Tax=Elysia crispata TaxID=231223 RepID=A0AAE1D7I6_9GAST|nr:hypothetical protein RRG08_008212 [Elysia crispata]